MIKAGFHNADGTSLCCYMQSGQALGLREWEDGTIAK